MTIKVLHNRLLGTGRPGSWAISISVLIAYLELCNSLAKNCLCFDVCEPKHGSREDELPLVMFSEKLRSLCFTHETQARDCDLSAWGSPLKRSQVCEERLYVEALVLSAAVFPGPKSTCQTSFAWHIQHLETRRCFPSTTVCISSLGIACTEALCYSTSDVPIPLEDFAFGVVGQACSWPGKGACFLVGRATGDSDESPG